MIRYVIKNASGYVTNHRRGRPTKHIGSARMFKTYRGAKSNKFCGDAANILTIDIDIIILEN